MGGGDTADQEDEEGESEAEEEAGGVRGDNLVAGKINSTFFLYGALAGRAPGLIARSLVAITAVCRNGPKIIVRIRRGALVSGATCARTVYDMNSIHILFLMKTEHRAKV